MGRGLTVAAAAAAGVILWLASPPAGLGWLAWVAIVPVACVVLADPPPPGVRWAVPLAYLVWLELAIVPDLPPGIAEGQWGDPLLPLVAGTPAPAVGIVVLPALALLLAAVGFGRPGPAARLPGRLGALGAVAAPAIAWTALEVVATRVAPGAAWSTVAVSQQGSFTAGLAALGGPYLITLAVAAVNYAVALALVRRTAATVAGAGALAVAVATGAALAPVHAGDGELTVAAVQPGYDTAEEVPATRAFRRRDYEPAAHELIDDLEPMTREAAAAGARLVVWPEAAIWVAPARTPSVHDRLADLARELGTAIVVSYFLRQPATTAVLVVSAGGALSEPVPKQRPMWYLGERRGPGRMRTLPAAGTAIGTLPGVDNEDPAVARRLVNSGARVLVAVTHDWEQLAVHRRASASLAALATGVPVVHSDWRYGSGIWRSDGALAAGRGTTRDRALLIATVAPGDPTPYVAAGAIVGDAALILALLLAGAAALRAAGRRQS